MRSRKRHGFNMTEWEFTGDVASWINVTLSQTPIPPFSQAKIEQRGKGDSKRRDLTLLDASLKPVVTGEVKLPYAADGGTPYNAKVVEDARRKAQRAKAKFFFTWNVNECVLWETVPAGTAWHNREFRSWAVPNVNVRQDSHLENPIVQGNIKAWLATFLHDLAQIVSGQAVIGHRSPDEKFVQTLESSLHPPVMLTIEALAKKYARVAFRSTLDRWMREDQGWTIYTDADGVRGNLTNAAKFACYALVNKLVFYEALLKRYGATLPKLDVPSHVTTGDALRTHLEGFFDDAKRITGDYETVFGEEHLAVGNRIPFYADPAVQHWQQIINQIHLFDFSKLDYEVIGSIFERLISPEERRKYGQFYTRVEVVDLINSFCIRTGDEKVMDPACGGGTFLVRAYARKRELRAGRRHGELLSDLYGVDVSTFATHLTTINLATRDLIDEENYPRIARSDFFDVEPNHPFLALPVHLRTKGLGKMQHQRVTVPALDAVVGNPPYVRQEDIPKSPAGKSPKPGTKEYYQRLAKRHGANLSGRSDIHCYFWPHASRFLKDDGWLCFITSSQWLDVEYGFRLQEWLLRNFQIVAVLESIDEPWFVGARVATTVTIAKRQADPARRMNNIVRFVQMRCPIAEVLAHDGTMAGAVEAADAFRDEILALAKNTANKRYRARMVRQGDLWNDGVRLAMTMGKGHVPASSDPDVQAGHYLGGKWGVYVRAPDLWFEMLDRFGTRLQPLGELSSVRFGVKSGKDCFFFPKDVSQTCLDEHADVQDFRNTYGVPRKKVADGSVKLVSCGKGWGEIRPIEAKYLVPEVHSLMDINGFTVAPGDCSRQMLLVGLPRDKLKGTYVLRYIEWGEKQGYHKGPTCAARVTEKREWYDLTAQERPSVILPKIQQYRLFTILNRDRLHAASALLGLYDLSLGEAEEICGILNSTFAVLSRILFARVHGVEGSIQLDVYSAEMMLVPDPGQGTRKARQRVAAAFRRLKKREAMYFLSEQRLRKMKYEAQGRHSELAGLSDQCELDMPDRTQLDDAVLELLGVTSKAERQKLVARLHKHLRQFFEWTRQKEEKAIVNKKTAKRRAATRPADIAAQIHRHIHDNEGQLLRQYNPDFIDLSKPFDTFDLPKNGVPEKFSDLYTAHGVRFVQGKKRAPGTVHTTIPEQDDLVVLLANAGVRGLVRVPRDADECEHRLKQYGRFVTNRNKRLGELVAERTADVDAQEQIMDALLTMLVGR